MTREQALKNLKDFEEYYYKVDENYCHDVDEDRNYFKHVLCKNHELDSTFQSEMKIERLITEITGIIHSFILYIKKPLVYSEWFDGVKKEIFWYEFKISIDVIEPPFPGVSGLKHIKRAIEKATKNHIKEYSNEEISTIKKEADMAIQKYEKLLISSVSFIEKYKSINLESKAIIINKINSISYKTAHFLQIAIDLGDAEYILGKINITGMNKLTFRKFLMITDFDKDNTRGKWETISNSIRVMGKDLYPDFRKHGSGKHNIDFFGFQKKWSKYKAIFPSAS